VTAKRKLIVSVLGAAIVGAVALALAASYFFGNDAPARASIEDAVNSSPSDGQLPADLTGEWTLAEDANSFAGFRINQQVAGIGSETVVGRTSDVEASLTFDGAAITDANVTVDMTTLKSGESLRDSALRSEGLESSRFRDATFALTAPVPMEQVPATGAPVAKTVSGDLTLHGVTRPIELQMQAAIDGSQLVVVGSHDIELGDFGITPPRGPASVLSVDDNGTLEMQLIFEKAA
jgi:polyisoprenoid-binding protein YceI